MSKDAVTQPTLADIIIAKIKEKAAIVSSEVLPQLDTELIGKILSNCTDGKIPKLFKLIPSMINWEDILYLIEPEKWSPNAMYQAVRIFASNMGVKRAERFDKLVLLPQVREDIRKNKRLHFALVALLKLADMEYCGTTSYFIKILLEKKYALPYQALDALVAHFVRFSDDTRIMPVIWHQSLLAFVQMYKNELQKKDKVNLRALIEKQNHKLITPEITRELNNSRNRVEKEDDLMLIDILCLQGSLRCCSIPYLADDLLGRVFDECPDIKILKKLHSKIFFDQHLHQNPSLAIELMRGYAANEETRITHHIFDFDEMSVKNVVFFNVMMV
ncbi:hypothetical protein F8388_022461 [Cannabis sativa]|uniref:Bystin n=1 Tax=Cannabis sativa TaxID=3483 RepID=A0A7J6EWK3_CANSA|nr:hypothetical protein F8388_022461 [Cannabis sativa]